MCKKGGNFNVPYKWKEMSGFCYWDSNPTTENTHGHDDKRYLSFAIGEKPMNCLNICPIYVGQYLSCLSF